MSSRAFGIRITKEGYVPGILKTGPFHTRLDFEQIVKIGLGLKDFKNGHEFAMIMLGDTEAVYLTEDIIRFLRNNPKATKAEIMAAGIVVDGLEPSIPLPSLKDLVMTVEGAIEVLKPFKILYSCPSIEQSELDKIVSEMTFEFNTARFEKIDNETFKALIPGQGIIVGKHKRLANDIPLTVTAHVVPTTFAFINDVEFTGKTVGDKINFALEVLDAQGNDINILADDVVITVDDKVTADKVSPSSFTLTTVTAGSSTISLSYKGVLTLNKTFDIAPLPEPPEPTEVQAGEIGEEADKETKKKK